MRHTARPARASDDFAPRGRWSWLDEGSSHMIIFGKSRPANFATEHAHCSTFGFQVLSTSPPLIDTKMATVINVNTVKSRHAFVLDPLCFSIRFDSKASPQDLPEHIVSLVVSLPVTHRTQVLVSAHRNLSSGSRQLLRPNHTDFGMQKSPHGHPADLRSAELEL